MTEQWTNLGKINPAQDPGNAGDAGDDRAASNEEWRAQPGGRPTTVDMTKKRWRRKLQCAEESAIYSEFKNDALAAAIERLGRVALAQKRTAKNVH